GVTILNIIAQQRAMSRFFYRYSNKPEIHSLKPFKPKAEGKGNIVMNCSRSNNQAIRLLLFFLETKIEKRYTESPN
ncbi:MAG: hypothetical protein AAB069_09110, partial [Planctomycetota bacterium]